jgi:hypothetical protein
LVRWLIGAYVLVAVLSRLAEAAGAQRCGCAQDCWCKRPVLSTFRWVFPYGHQSIDAREKEVLAKS